MPKQSKATVKVIIGPKSVIQAPIVIGDGNEQDVGVCQVPLASLSEKEFAFVARLIEREARKGPA